MPPITLWSLENKLLRGIERRMSWWNDVGLFFMVVHEFGMPLDKLFGFEFSSAVAVIEIFPANGRKSSGVMKLMTGEHLHIIFNPVVMHGVRYGLLCGRSRTKSQTNNDLPRCRYVT